MANNRVRHILSRYVAVVIPLAISILLAASSLVDGGVKISGRRIEWSWLLVLLAGTLGLVEAGLVARRQSRLKELDSWTRRATSAEAALLNQIREELIGIEAQAGFFSSERISLFRCEPNGFVLIGRRSRNPRYDQSLGRKVYPPREGVIAAAWEAADGEEHGLPTAGTGPDPRRAWQQAQAKKWSVPEDVSASFAMRSEWYIGIRIDTRESALGVIVFESTVTPTDASAAGATVTLRDRAQLDRLVKLAGSRLASLIVACRAIDADRIRELMAADDAEAP